MTHPPTSYPRSQAMDNRLVRIEFSTATWFLIWSVLDGRPIGEASTNTRRWACDHIARQLLEAHGYAQPE